MLWTDHIISARFILIISFPLCFIPPSDFLSGFPTKILYELFTHPMRATCHAYLPFLDLISQVIARKWIQNITAKEQWKLNIKLEWQLLIFMGQNITQITVTQYTDRRRLKQVLFVRLSDICIIFWNVVVTDKTVWLRVMNQEVCESHSLPVLR